MPSENYWQTMPIKSFRLYPGESGNFTPESVPDGTFRDLEHWVSYVIETDQKSLAAWIDATRIEFDHFVCKDAGRAKKQARQRREEQG